MDQEKHRKKTDVRREICWEWDFYDGSNAIIIQKTLKILLPSFCLSLCAG